MRESITPEESTEPIVIEEIGVRLGVEDRSTTSGKTEADLRDEPILLPTIIPVENAEAPQSPLGATVPTGDKETDSGFSERWTKAVIAFHRPIKTLLLAVTHHAARNPKHYLLGIAFFSLSLIVLGFFTNFYIENSEAELWKQKGSRTVVHGRWIDEEWKNEWQAQGRAYAHVDARKLTTMVHKGGENVVSRVGMLRNFEVVDTIRATPKYKEYCALYGKIPTGEDTPLVCEISGVSGFWLHNTSLFESDQEAAEAMSIDSLPGEAKQFADLKQIVGYPVFEQNGTLSGLSFLTNFVLDGGGAAIQLERDLLKRMLHLRQEWEEDENNPYSLEIISPISFPDEFNRGIVKDIPLVALVFVEMAIFTCIVFSKADWVHSRSMLGLGAVACVLLSIMTGYGLMFLIGVPFTSLTQVLPFVIFGIGLDDAFILIAAYTRTDVSKDTVERVHDTVDEVGMSIFMTTATSVLAFGLGCISSLPAVRWLCLYALFTIAIDFVYQITFFIALIVIDERRVADRRRDCLVCCVVKRPADEAMEEDAPSEKRIGERVMAWYADILLIPKVKVLVIAVFTALLFVCAFSASKLELDFDTTITLPDDSYIISFTEAAQDYIQRPSVSPFVYFRNVDHSDPAVRAQMEAYVNDLVAIDWISDQPVDFWLRDYNKYVAENENDLRGLTFNETIHMFVDDPKYDNGGSIMFDINGNIHASRTRVGMDRVNQSQVYDMLAALKDQRQVGSEQPINHGGGDWAFFTFSHVYYLWEFVAATVDELKLTTIIGVAAVSLMSVLFLPHWSGVLFVSPLITILYVNLLGFLQLFGITINAVTFVALVISIGLLVDFVMHIALRYFESTEIGRVEKTKDVLRTMGIPVLLGGLSTFFGIMPLALASNGVLRIFFISFVGIVSLGVTHALILFPVVLSVIGPN